MARRPCPSADEIDTPGVWTRSGQGLGKIGPGVGGQHTMTMRGYVIHKIQVIMRFGSYG